MYDDLVRKAEVSILEDKDKFHVPCVADVFDALQSAKLVRVDRYI